VFASLARPFFALCRREQSEQHESRFLDDIPREETMEPRRDGVGCSQVTTQPGGVSANVTTSTYFLYLIHFVYWYHIFLGRILGCIDWICHLVYVSRTSQHWHIHTENKPLYVPKEENNTSGGVCPFRYTGTESLRAKICLKNSSSELTKFAFAFACGSRLNYTVYRWHCQNQITRYLWRCQGHD
jgi:hypothetical protein